MIYSLQGKTVVLTGASGGFGRALTEQPILNNNCYVIGIGRREDKMLELRQRLGKKEDRFSYSLFDVTKPEPWKRFRSSLSVVPDVLIHCAGILPAFEAFAGQDSDVFRHTMEINCLSATIAAKELLPLLLQSPDPMIVNISSSSALCPVAGAAAYSASKAALLSFSEALRAEFRGKITVCTVCPGFSITDIFRNQKEPLPGEALMRRIATPPDKMAKKILRRIRRRKRLSVCGSDAKLMAWSYRIAPGLTVKVMRDILRKSGEPMFRNI